MREILRAGIKTGSGTLAVIFFGVLSTKIMALVLGPAGMGLFSLLSSMQSMMVTLGSLGGQEALVQGLSSRDGRERDVYMVTTFWLVLLGAAATAGSLIVFAPSIALRMIGQDGPQIVSLVRWLALPVCLSIGYSFFNAVLNGFRSIGTMAVAQAAAAAVGLLLAYPVASWAQSGFPSAFVALMTARAAISGSIVLLIAWRAGWLAPLSDHLRSGLDPAAVRHFFSIAGTTLVAGLVHSSMTLAVRALVVKSPAGLAGAGIFDVAWTLSSTYVMLILSSFGTYYFPTLAGTKDPQARNTLIRQLMRLQVLLMVPLVVAVVALKPLMIQALYSDKFLESLHIIRWMLIGDYIKVASFVLTMPLLAYADMKAYFWTDASLNVGFWLLSILGVRYAGVEGVGASFAVTYALFFVYLFLYVRRRYDLSFSPTLVRQWLLGIAFVCAASWTTWNDQALHWLKTPGLIGGAILFSAMMITRSERTGLREMAGAYVARRKRKLLQ
jgi:O-antigen/teichoic acid export membrane protein